MNNLLNIKIKGDKPLTLFRSQDKKTYVISIPKGNKIIDDPVELLGILFDYFGEEQSNSEYSEILKKFGFNE